MERAFRKAPYPDVTVRERLAKTLGLNESRIQVRLFVPTQFLYFYFDKCVKNRTELNRIFMKVGTRYIILIHIQCIQRDKKIGRNMLV